MIRGVLFCYPSDAVLFDGRAADPWRSDYYTWMERPSAGRPLASSWRSSWKGYL